MMKNRSKRLSNFDVDFQCIFGRFLKFFGLALGPNCDQIGLWRPSWRQNGAKMDQKSEKWRFQNDIKNVYCKYCKYCVEL